MGPLSDTLEGHYGYRRIMRGFGGEVLKIPAARPNGADC
jgi:hypothetical protein